MTAVFRLQRRAAQCLAVAHQLGQTLGLAWDLTDHPGLELLAKLLHLGLIEQVEKGGIRCSTIEIQAQLLVQCLAVSIGEPLQITRAAAAAQDPQHSHQQQEPLWVPDTTALTAVRNGLEEADQISWCKLINRTGIVLGSGKLIDPPTKPNADRFSKSY